MPLAPITGFVYWKRFGALPHVGGTFQQPAELLEEMTLVHDVFENRQAEARQAEMNRQQQRARR